MSTTAIPKPQKSPEPNVYDPRTSIEGYPNTPEDKNFALKVKNARPKLFSESKYANTIKRPLTTIEKIWFAHLEAGNPDKKGSIIYVKPDLLLMQDATAKLLLIQAELLFTLLEKEQSDILTVLYYDHNIKVDFGIEKAIVDDKDGIKFLGTSSSKRGIIFSLPGNGICHRVSDEYFDMPGGILFGSDSHTPTAGGMGMFVVGKGGWSIAKSLAAGLPMPVDRNPIIGVHLKGSLPDGIEPKQIVSILNRDIIRFFGTEGNGSYIEFFGEGVKSVSVVGRSSITNSLVDGGMGTGVFPADEQVINYLKTRNRPDLAEWVSKNLKDLNPDPEVLQDPGKYYDITLEYDLSKEIHPALAMPGNPKNVFYLDEIPKVINFINDEIFPNYKNYLINGKTDRLKVEEACKIKSKDVLRATALETLVNFAVQEVDVKKSYDKRKLSLEVSSGSVGSCTHSGKDDIEAVVWANIQLAKNKIKRNAPVSVTYGSRDGWLSVQGNKTIQDLITDGHLILLDSACGPCIGMGFAPAVESASVRSFNRNFMGRGGNKEKIDQVYLTSPAVVVYLAASGRFDSYDAETKTFKVKDESGKEVKVKLTNPTSEASLKAVVANDFNNPDGERPAFILPAPKDKAKDIKVLYDGETIAPLPGDMYDTPPSKLENLPVLVALGDNVTTDDLSAAGTKYIPKRGNLLELEPGYFESISLREGKDPQFYYNLAKEYKTKTNGSVMVGGKLFGSGSSREAAAFIPRHLRVRVAIAESFAPIHRENAIEQGLFYMTYKNPADRSKFDRDDLITISGLDKLDADNRDVEVKIKKKDGSEVSIICEHVLDTPYKIEVFRAGSEPNLFKKILIDQFKGDVTAFMKWFEEKNRL
jgi:aconitase A